MQYAPLKFPGVDSLGLPWKYAQVKLNPALGGCCVTNYTKRAVKFSQSGRLARRKLNGPKGTCAYQTWEDKKTLRGTQLNNDTATGAGTAAMVFWNQAVKGTSNGFVVIKPLITSHLRLRSDVYLVLTYIQYTSDLWRFWYMSLYVYIYIGKRHAVGILL